MMSSDLLGCEIGYLLSQARETKSGPVWKFSSQKFKRASCEITAMVQLLRKCYLQVNV